MLCCIAMKFIFDFDDVLLNNTGQFKPHMFACIAKAGVPRNVAEGHYKEKRVQEFSLRDFITHLFSKYEIAEPTIENVYTEIMGECKNFINTELVEVVKKLGKENCWIITNGEQVFNHDKVFMSGLDTLFSEIHIVPGSKKEIIEKICAENKNEKVIFVDDKAKFIDDINMTKCPNLKTILYDTHGLEKVKAEILE